MSSHNTVRIMVSLTEEEWNELVTSVQFRRIHTLRSPPNSKLGTKVIKERASILQSVYRKVTERLDKKGIWYV